MVFSLNLRLVSSETGSRGISFLNALLILTVIKTSANALLSFDSLSLNNMPKTMSAHAKPRN